jgi:hypothetical protein
LLIYQPLTGPLLRTCLLQRAYSIKEAQVQTPRAEPSLLKSCLTGRATLIVMQPNIPTLRRDSLGQSPYKKIKASPPQPEIRGRSPENSLDIIYIYIFHF